MGAETIPCPKCGDRSSTVYDGRPYKGAFKRRRKCGGCGVRYVTYEVSDHVYEAMTAGNLDEMITSTEGLVEGLRAMRRTIDG